MVLPNTRYRAQKQWQSIQRQRIIKNGNQPGDSNPVPGWVSDGTYLATIIDHKLVVEGSGSVEITAVISIINYVSGGRTVTLYHNGTALGAFTTNANGVTTLGPYSRTVADGDTVYLATAGFYTYQGTIQGGTTYIDVNPT